MELDLGSLAPIQKVFPQRLNKHVEFWYGNEQPEGLNNY